MPYSPYEKQKFDPNKFRVTEESRQKRIDNRIKRGYTFRVRGGRTTPIGRTGVYLKLIPAGKDGDMIAHVTIGKKT